MERPNFTRLTEPSHPWNKEGCITDVVELAPGQSLGTQEFLKSVAEFKAKKPALLFPLNVPMHISVLKALSQERETLTTLTDAFSFTHLRETVELAIFRGNEDKIQHGNEWEKTSEEWRNGILQAREDDSFYIQKLPIKIFISFVSRLQMDKQAENINSTFSKQDIEQEKLHSLAGVLSTLALSTLQPNELRRNKDFNSIIVPLTKVAKNYFAYYSNCLEITKKSQRDNRALERLGQQEILSKAFAFYIYQTMGISPSSLIQLFTSLNIPHDKDEINQFSDNQSLLFNEFTNEKERNVLTKYAAENKLEETPVTLVSPQFFSELLEQAKDYPIELYFSDKDLPYSHCQITTLKGACLTLLLTNPTTDLRTVIDIPTNLMPLGLQENIPNKEKICLKIIDKVLHVLDDEGYILIPKEQTYTPAVPQIISKSLNVETFRGQYSTRMRDEKKRGKHGGKNRPTLEVKNPNIKVEKKSFTKPQSIYYYDKATKILRPFIQDVSGDVFNSFQVTDQRIQGQCLECIERYLDGSLPEAQIKAMFTGPMAGFIRIESSDYRILFFRRFLDKEKSIDIITKVGSEDDQFYARRHNQLDHLRKKFEELEIADNS